MRLAVFIDSNLEAILKEWESFAQTLLPEAADLDSAGLRDHAEQILRAAIEDMREPQNPRDQYLKSRGGASARDGYALSAARKHGRLRAREGFSLDQVVAEYRALRATVLRLWDVEFEPHAEALADVTRFNEAIDQSITESVSVYAHELEHWRDVFLGVLGHDLRAPLHSILMVSQLLVHDPNAPVSVLAPRLVRGAERMRHLLDDLLVYSRISLNLEIPVEVSHVDLAREFEEEIELQQAIWPKRNIVLLATGAVDGVWDAHRLKQALANLISNAVRYGSQDAPIVVRLDGGGKEIEIAVENEGSTISPNDIKTLFEPLRRASGGLVSAGRENLGLGLFIVKQIASSHKGTVSVTSREGKTVFRIKLPQDSAR